MSDDDVTLVRRYIQAKPQLRARTKRTDVLEALDRIVRRLPVPVPMCECGHNKGEHCFPFSLRSGTGWCGHGRCSCHQFRLAARSPSRTERGAE